MVRKTFLWRKRLLAFWRRMYALTSADPLQREIPPHLDVKTWENCVWHAFLAAKLVSLISLIWLLDSRKASLLKRSNFFKKNLPNLANVGFPNFPLIIARGLKNLQGKISKRREKGNRNEEGKEGFLGVKVLVRAEDVIGDTSFLFPRNFF